MKRKTGKTITSSYEETETLCDFCGLDVERENDSYTRNEVTIECLVGDSYPEGDSREAHVIDCCHVCFLAKVKPAIEALGVKMRQVAAEDR